MGPAGAVIAQRLCAVPSVGETDGTAQFFLMSHSSTVSRVALFFEIVLICDITGSGDIAGGHKTKKECHLGQGTDEVCEPVEVCGRRWSTRFDLPG